MQLDVNIQRILFNLIEERTENPNELIKELEQLLCIENRSLRNRQRGDTYLTLPEFYRLARHYKISLDDIAIRLENHSSDHTGLEVKLTDVSYLPLLSGEFMELKYYIENLRYEFEKLQNQGDHAWLKMTCTEVPLVHLMAFEELAYFKIYTYYYHIVKLDITFEEFLKKIQPLNLSEHFKAISEAYGSISSEEIWDGFTFEKLLRLLAESVFFGKFEKQKTLDHLLDQIDSLVNYIKTMVAKGEKMHGGTVELYYFESVMRESFVLTGSDDIPAEAMLKIFMIQSVGIKDPDFSTYLDLTFQALKGRSNPANKCSELVKTKLMKKLSKQVEDYRAKVMKM
ncbi:hypothetical protein [Sphingobacterium sp. UBA2074]|uniref:hypothetical protein n=1 Tax=Sphingobacterium sp. UBA2074 TaxID=1947487 RepID=UPI00257EA36D|nr:hypothetical protein [Sphingobacterium sp. UBA2074]